MNSVSMFLVAVVALLVPCSDCSGGSGETSSEPVVGASEAASDEPGWAYWAVLYGYGASPGGTMEGCLFSSEFGGRFAFHERLGFSLALVDVAKPLERASFLSLYLHFVPHMGTVAISDAAEDQVRTAESPESGLLTLPLPAVRTVLDVYLGGNAWAAANSWYARGGVRMTYYLRPSRSAGGFGNPAVGLDVGLMLLPDLDDNSVVQTGAYAAVTLGFGNTTLDWGDSGS